MRQADDRARMAKIWAERQAERRANHVRLVRRYRKGELPDIQIPHADLLRPLLVLQSEPGIAAATLTLLFRAFQRWIDQADDLPEDEGEQVRESVRRGLLGLMQRTACASPNFVSLLHTLCLECSGLKIQPEALADTALRTRTFATGILALERQLVNAALGSAGEASAPQAKKSKKKASSDDFTQRAWAQLSRLYRELGEHDVFMGLHERASTQAITRQAIAASLRQDYVQALECYEQATQWLDEGAGHTWDNGENPPEHEINLWEDERMECFRRLGQWQIAEQNVLAQTDNDVNKLWEQPSADSLTRIFLQGALRLPDAYLPTAVKFVEDSSKDGNKLARLETRFAPELIALSAKAGLAKAPLLVKNFYERFLADWTSLSPLAVGARANLLRALQEVVEAEEFLALRIETASQRARASWPSRLDTLLRLWSSRFPGAQEASDTSSSWDSVISNRALWLAGARFNLHELGKDPVLLEQVEPVRLQALDAGITECMMSSFCQAADAFARAGNVGMAEAYCHSARSLDVSGRSFQLMLLQAQLDLTRATHIASDRPRVSALFRLSQVLDAQQKSVDMQSANLLYRYHDLKADVYDNMAQLLTQTPTLVLETDNLDARTMYRIIGQTRQNAVDSLTAKLSVASQRALAAWNGSGGSVSVSEEQRHLAKAHMKLGQFCLHRLSELRPEEDGDDAQVMANAEELDLAGSALINVFQAMQCLDQEAINLIPQLVSLAARYPSAAPTFTEHSEAAPAWVFLRWIAQLLAHLSKPSQAELVINILERIADQYPQAIFYPFQLTSEDLAQRREATPYMARLTQRLSGCAHLHAFTEALDQLNYPHLKLKDLALALNQVNTSSASESEKLSHAMEAVVEYERKVLFD